MNHGTGGGNSHNIHRKLRVIGPWPGQTDRHVGRLDDYCYWAYRTGIWVEIIATMWGTKHTSQYFVT